MKIAISSRSGKLTDPIDSRFGRASYFIIYNLEDDSYEVLENSQNLNATQGAGIQAAMNVINSDATALLTGHCGPKAFRTLATGEIAIYCDVKGSIEDAITSFKENKLTVADSADVEGHWA